jgi:hypothetical protein
MAVYLLRVFFYPERRQSLPFFANPTQVLRKFAKKPKRVLREVPKKLRRKCLVKAGNKSKSGSEEVLTSEASSAPKKVLREAPKKLRSLCLAEGGKSTHFSRLARKVAPPPEGGWGRPRFVPGSYFSYPI